MKGITIITEVLFVAIIITLIFVVYIMAAPVMKSMQESSAFEQAKSVMLTIDESVQEVASQGGKRSFHVTLGSGTAELDEATDSLVWSMNTDSMIISPRSMQKIGNLVVGSNLDTAAYTDTSAGAYVLENDIIRVKLKMIGSRESPALYNTSDIVMEIYNKKIPSKMPLHKLEILIDGSPDSANGTGYTEIVNEGYSLPRGEVLAHINTSYAFLNNYTVTFTLESGADFLIIEAEES